MSRRFVHHGIPILAALALLLTLLPSLGHQARGPFRITSRCVHSSHRGIAAQIAGRGLDAPSQRRLSLEAGRSDQLDFRDEMDFETEDESTFAYLPAPPSFDLLPSPRLVAICSKSFAAVSDATRPMRC